MKLEKFRAHNLAISNGEKMVVNLCKRKKIIGHSLVCRIVVRKSVGKVVVLE